VTGPERKLPARIGRYDVEVVLGQGAVGRTFLARDPAIGRHVAVKVVRDDLGLSPERHAALVARVRERTRAAATFAHPVMAVLYDLGDDASAGPYFVFELLEGHTLRERLGNGGLPRSEAARLARTLGPALAMGHSVGTFHGNIKPDNVVFAAGGPKLTGAGFAAPPDLVTALADAPSYAAPEVQAGGPASAAADQFSLAATLYEALTGRPPFSGENARAVAEAVARTKHAAPTSLLAELRACPHIDTIFDRALAKDPHRRFPACDAFTSALAASLEAAHSAGLETPISQASIVPRATRRWQNAAAAAGVLVIFALVLLGREPHGAGVSLKSVAGAFAMTLAASPRPALHTRPQPPGGVTPRANATPAPALSAVAAAQDAGTTDRGEPTDRGDRGD
jgi:serine/threonine-protein kinase